MSLPEEGEHLIAVFFLVCHKYTFLLYPNVSIEGLLFAHNKMHLLSECKGSVPAAVLRAQN
jgi:hypothetical protein